MSSKELDIFTKSILNSGDNGIHEIIEEDKINGLYVYRMNYLFGLIDALKGKFATIHILLGEENFNFFARKYIINHPSRQENIDLYGDNFHLFLSTQNELIELFYLEDLGRLDLLWFWGRQGDKKSTHVASGLYHLWENLSNGVHIENIEIDMNKTETIFIMEERGETFLALVDSGRGK